MTEEYLGLGGMGDLGGCLYSCSWGCMFPPIREVDVHETNLNLNLSWGDTEEEKKDTMYNMYSTLVTYTLSLCHIEPSVHP